MLKPYDKPEDIPDELKEHYSRREDGKYHADIPNDHPAVKHNATLLSEKQQAEEKARTAEAALESAKASGLPRGHVAVTTADKTFLDTVKSLGSADEIKSKLTKHDELLQESVTRQKVDALKEAAKGAGYDPEKVAALEDRFPIPEFRDVKVGDKTERQTFFKVKDGDKEVERSFAEHLEADPKLKLLSDGLKAQGGGTPFPRQPSGGRAPASDVFTKIRQEEEDKKKVRKPAATLDDRFPRAVSA